MLAGGKHTLIISDAPRVHNSPFLILHFALCVFMLDFLGESWRYEQNGRKMNKTAGEDGGKAKKCCNNPTNMLVLNYKCPQSISCKKGGKTQ